MEYSMLGGRVNVIIVDDDKIDALIATRLISQAFPESNVISFYKAEEALSFLANNIPGKVFNIPVLLLLDIHMPVMNAWNFIENAIAIDAQMFKNVDIFVLSASIHPSDVNKASSYAEVKSYLEKPLKNAVIKSLISHFRYI